MVAVFKDVEAQALALPEHERSALVARLLDSLDSVFDDSPEAVERAWQEEVARRVKEFESGAGQDVSDERVQAQLQAMLERGAT